MENPPNKKDDEKQAAFLDYVLAMERLKAKFAREGDSETASKIEEALVRDRKHPFYQETIHSFSSFSETEPQNQMDETEGKTQNQPPATSSDALQETLTSSDDIGQIKQALGRLYKRIDEAEVVQKEQREKDRQVLHLWAETNLIQTELLKKQTRLIEQLTQELQKNETYWQKYAKSSADLMRDLIALKQQLMTMPPQVSSAGTMLTEMQVTGEEAILPLLIPHRMKPREMQELEAALARLWRESEEMPSALRLERLSQIARSLEEIGQGKQRIQKIEFDVVPLEKKTALRIASIAVIAVVALVTGAGIILMNISGIDEIKNALNGMSTRLTKVEKTVERLKN